MSDQLRHMGLRRWLWTGSGIVPMLLLIATAFSQEGISPELEEMFKKTEQAAEKGNRQSQYNLGLLYIGANGYPKNYKKAQEWFRIAMENGSSNAVYNLAILAEQGLVTDPNPKEAFDLYKIAAEKGVVPAAYKVWDLSAAINASAIGEGEEEVISPEEAIGFLTQAADGGAVRAQAQLGKEYLTGDKIGKDIKAAVGYLQQAAKEGDSGSSVLLGKLSVKGLAEFKPTLEEMVDLLVPLADEGDAEAQLVLGDIYASDVIGESQLSEAVEWYSKASKRGNVMAKAKLGIIYSKKDTSFYDAKKAERFLLAASKAGIPEAQFQMFKTLYSEGDDNYKTKRQTLIWLKAAAKSNFGPAQVQLAKFFMKGELIPRSPKEAYIWSTVAIENGETGAQQVQDEAVEAMSRIQVAEAKSEAKFRIRQIKTQANQGSAKG